MDINKIKADIEDKFECIKDIHHIHIWSMDGVNNYMTCHILLNDEMNKDEIIKLKKDLKAYIKEFKIKHITLEVEYKGESCKEEKC